MLQIILGIVISYLIGSIPTAYIFVRLLKDEDIRKFGSGNVGATNALRVLGKGAGISVLLLDILKGCVAVIFLADLIFSKNSLHSLEVMRMILGLSCICGHIWTIFLKFKGGKGVATTFGVLLGLAIKVNGLLPILALAMLTWLAAFLLLRIVSLASVLAGISIPIFTMLIKPSGAFMLTTILMAILIILRHRSNLVRAWQGKEPRLSFRKSH